MNPDSAKTTVLTSAMVVAAMRLWLQVRGKAKTPIQDWVIGWGATFFILSLISDAMPTAAGGLALLVAFSDFLENGVTLTTDISGIITGKETGPILAANPLGGSSASSTTPATTTPSADPKAPAGSTPAKTTGTAVGQVTNADLATAGAKYHWNAAELADWVKVITRESGGSTTATNPSSGAYGIAQFIQGPSQYAQYGGNSTSVSGQLTSMASYISQRYGSPSAAWAHEQSNGWY